MQENMMGQNIIITERCRSLRQLGRNALRGKWANGIIAMIIYILVLHVPVIVFDQLFGVNMATLMTDDSLTYNMDPEVYQQLLNSMPHTSFLSGIWLLLISGAMQLGLMIYFLASFRGHAVKPKDIFLGFERFGKALGLFLFQFVFIFLWSCLFIIPGIIASIRYSQAFFVLADDPSKSIRQCMNESKFMMRGNKGKYFLLGLSFIGWMIISAIPGSMVVSIVSTMTDNEGAMICATLLESLFMMPVYVYVYSTFAGFYEILSGHLIKETEPAPLSADQIAVDAPIEKIEKVIEEVENGTESRIEPRESILEEDLDEEIPKGEVLPEPLDEEEKYND